MTRLLLLSLALLCTPLAAAAELSAREQIALERGRPYVEVASDPDGESGVIRAGIDIGAPPEQVFRVITDCELATRMVPTLKSCRVLDRDPAGRWDVREHVSRQGFLPSVRNVFRSDYEAPFEVRFRKVGGDLRVFQGEWRIEPHAGGARVSYDSRASLPFHAPGPLARMALRMEVQHALLALRREVALEPR